MTNTFIAERVLRLPYEKDYAGIIAMSIRLARVVRFLLLLGVAVLATVMIAIPIRISITQTQLPQPQAILMLGGGIEREMFTAKFAQQHPNLPLWISTGSLITEKIFAKANIDSQRVHYDNRATDTITNFTTIVQRLQNHEIRHVYLITSDYHMPRSRAIGTIVLGSRGIIFTPVEVPSQKESEATIRIIRDVGRAFLWVFTGWTGARFNPRLSSSNGIAEWCLEEPDSRLIYAIA